MMLVVLGVIWGSRGDLGVLGWFSGEFDVI